MKRTMISLAAVAGLLLSIGFTSEMAQASPAALPVGACEVKANNPHNSSHVGGTVNGVGSVTCTSSIPTIRIRTTLVRLGVTQTTGNNTVSSTSYAQSNAALVCQPGQYQVIAYASVDFPNGTTRSLETAGVTVSLTCDGRISRSAETPESSSTTVTW